MTLESAASRQSTSRALAGNIGSISRPGLGASGRYANRVGGDALLVIRALQVSGIVDQRARRNGAAAVQVHSVLPCAGLPVPVAFGDELHWNWKTSTWEHRMCWSSSSSGVWG